jgi:hypothetical protein
MGRVARPVPANLHSGTGVTGLASFDPAKLNRRLDIMPAGLALWQFAWALSSQGKP